jgi:hypothetical protein
VRFSIYASGEASVADSGALEYRETVTVTPDATGIFTELIGDDADAGFSFDAAIFATDQPLFVQVNVPFDGDALLPRTPLLSVPFAAALSPGAEVQAVPLVEAVNAVGTTATFSDDVSEVIGRLFPDDGDGIAASSAMIPAGATDADPRLTVTVEIINSLPLAGQRTALFGFRLTGTESGAVRIFEVAHEFSGEGPEVVEVPIAASGGDFIPGEPAAWTIRRLPNQPRDTLIRDILFLGGVVEFTVTR